MRIDSLTSLRFFAALAVFIHHMDFFTKSPNADIGAAFTWGFEGFFGVQFFYILSGFVIALSFGKRLQKGPFPFSDFLFYRAARLFPIHWLGMASAIVIYGMQWDTFDSWMRFITQATLTQSFVANNLYFFGFNGVSWSISTEMFFYVMFCAIVGLNTKTLMTLWIVLFFIICANVAAADPTQPMATWLLYINPIFRFIDFLTGVLLYRWFVHSPLTMDVKKATAMEVGSLLFAVLFVWVSIRYQVPIQWRWDIYYILPMAAVIYVFAHQQGYLSRLLCNRVLILLGDASFALYMIHQLLINVSLQFFDPMEITRWRHAAVVSGSLLLCGIAISIVAHLAFEMPVNKKLRSIWIKSRSLKTLREIRI